MKRQLLALLGAEYGAEDVATGAYYDWQYRRGPYGEAIARVAVGNDGRVAGQYVVAPIRLVIDGVVEDGALSLLTLTDKRYRGQGVFTGLAREVFAECAARDHHWILGFPNRNSYSGFVGALQFRTLGELPLLLRVLHPSALVRSRAGLVLGGLSAAFVRPLDALYRSHIRASPNVVRVESFDDAFDAFDAVLTRRFRVHQPRTARFLQWRFAEGPREYETYGWYGDARLRGYVVLRRAVVSGLNCGMLVDLLVDDGPDAQSIGHELVQFAVARLYAMGAHLAGALVNRGTTEFAVLRRHRFFVCPQRLLPQPFPVIFKSLAAGRNELNSLTGWALGMGDYDAI